MPLTAESAEAMIHSACSPNLRRARSLLATEPELSRFDLACACVCGDADEVARRLTEDPAAATTATGPLRWEPILYACFTRLPRERPRRAIGVREVVRLLLAAGADPNSCFRHDDWLQVPLYGAAGIQADPGLTRLLLDAGADPNDSDDAHTVGEALYHACEHEDPTCARLLIEAGTNPDVVSYCLGRALNFPRPEMIEAFCAGGVRAYEGHIHQAVWRRRPASTITLLLEAGAPIDALIDDLTPLQVAVRWGDDAAAAALGGHGADATAVRDEDRALGAFLRDGGTPPAGATGLDPMVLIAVQQGDLATMRRLLDAGADLRATDTEEHPLLGEACWRGHADVVRELIARGASLQFGDGGSPIGAALHGSRHCHHPEGGPSMRTIDEIPKHRYAAVVRVLLEAGAEVRERFGDTKLLSAQLIADLGVDPPS